MPRLRVTIKTGYGTFEVAGESPDEVLEGLGWLSPEFVSRVTERIAEIAALESEDALEGIVRVDGEGPTIVTQEDLSHYECIGLILYTMRNHQASSKDIRERLVTSGKKVTLAARLHEMRNRGHVFKPDNRGSEYKLTTRGVRWIEDEVLPRLTDQS